MESWGSLCRYRTDAGGRLVFVDDGWCAFARENDAPQYAVRDGLYGRDLLSFISEPTTRLIYSALMQRVLERQHTIALPFRCDAPAIRRWLEMQMGPAEGGVEFKTREIRVEARRPLLSFTRVAADGDAMVRMCSWCKQLELDGGRWVEAEDAVTAMQLFGDRAVPALTHGICPSCVSLFERDPRR